MSDDDIAVPPAQRWPTIPEPTTDPKSLYNSLQRLKETAELLTGQRGVLDPTYSVDSVRTILTKTVNDLSATVTHEISVMVGENAAMAEQIDTVEAEVVAAREGEVSLSARIVEVDTASVTRDTAISTSLSQVSARVDDVSAGGFFRTTATVTGGTTLASMEAQVWSTTAHSGVYTAGWRVMISGGQSWFDIYSSIWRLIDTSGVPKTVMSYYSGQFHFNGNVALDGNLVVTGTITAPQLGTYAVENLKIYPNAVSTSGSADGYSEPITVSISIRAGSSVLILASTDASGNTSGGSAGLAIYVNGGSWRSVAAIAQTVVTGMSGGPEPTPISYTFFFPVSVFYVYIAGYTGTHTFQLYGTGYASGVYKALVCTELSK